MNYWELVIFFSILAFVGVSHIRFGFLPVFGFMVVSPWLAVIFYFPVGMILGDLARYLMTGHFVNTGYISFESLQRTIGWISLVMFSISCMSLRMQVNAARKRGEDSTGTDLFIGGGVGFN